MLVELIRRKENINYYKAKSGDVDFVLTKENVPFELIQVSYSINHPETYARETNSLLEASREVKLQQPHHSYFQ